MSSIQLVQWQASQRRTARTTFIAVLSLIGSLVWALVYPAVRFGYGVAPAAFTALWVIVSGVVLVAALVHKSNLHRPVR